MKLLNVTLKDTIRSGDKLYWRGKVYDVEDWVYPVYDLCIRHKNDPVYFLDKVYDSRRSNLHYYRVCIGTKRIGKIEPWEFNVVNV